MELDFQAIVDRLTGLLPAGWKKAVFMAEYTSGSYSMRLFADCGDGGYKDCMLAGGAKKSTVVKVCRETDRELQSCRGRLEGKALWYAVTISFECNGRFRSEFDYREHEGKALEYIETWKKSYLGQ